MLSSFYWCAMVGCEWSPVLCLQSFGEMLHIKENDAGGPLKRLVFVVVYEGKYCSLLLAK